MMEIETTRMTILAGILAIFFGIRQSIPETTFEVISMEFSLKFLSTMFFQILLWVYLIYFLILALRHGHKNLVKPKWTGFLFDIIVTMTTMVCFLTVSVLGTIQLVTLFPQHIQAGWKTGILLIGLLFIAAIWAAYNLRTYLRDLASYTAKS